MLVVLVSHDGAIWLPAVLDALADQSRAPAYVVAVDTGSRDGSPDLIEERGVPVVSTPVATGYGTAVASALQEADRAGLTPEWLWLLHDDSAPHERALEQLLEAAREHPDAALIGPKLREWPSLLRMLEVGVTISGTGRRETGLEAGEYDQGQHDEIRDVLAVNTAGLLIRSAALERLGGLEPLLPVFGADVDLGWRAADAGLRTIVVPSAVVFHAEAARRGLRRTPLTGAHQHLEERRAGLFVLLANSRRFAPLLQVPRLVLGTALRSIGFLAVREPARALDDLVALISVMGHPGALVAARRERAALRVADPADVRRLHAPPWVPYRHGLDVLIDLGVALTHQAGDVAERRREAAAGRDPSSFAARRRESLGADGAEEDTGLVARFVTTPVAVLTAVVVLIAVVASRHAVGGVAGGGLSPTPSSVGDWWRLLIEQRHPLLQGTSVPAPAYLLPLAILGTLLGGSAGAAVSLALLICVPMGLWGAWRFLRVLGRLASLSGMPRWLILWGATTYALLPVVSGAWSDGRLGPVVAATLLPWLAHAALGLADPEVDRRRRAGWRAGLLAAVVVAFAPLTWLVLVVLAAGVVAVGVAVVPSAMLDRTVWGPILTVLLVPVALLAPWWLWSLTSGTGAGLLLDIGRLPAAHVDGLDLLAGRLDGLGAPRVVGLVLPVLALVALVPRRSRAAVSICWAVAAVVGLLAAVLSFWRHDLAAATVTPSLTVVPVLLQGCFVIAVMLAAQTVVQARARPGVRRPLPARASLAALAVVGLAVPAVGLGWFVADPGVTIDDAADDIPAYMVQSAQQGPEHAILVLRGSTVAGLTYLVRRGDGVTLGEDEIIALSPADRSFTRDVGAFAARPTPEVVDTLARNGVEYVVLPAPADSDVAAALDATPGLVRSGAEDRQTRAWRIDRALDDGGVAAQRSVLRTLAVSLQGLAVLVVMALCVPTRRRTS